MVVGLEPKFREREHFKVTVNDVKVGEEVNLEGFQASFRSMGGFENPDG